MNQDLAIQLIPVISNLDVQFHPLLRKAIANKVFVGPLAKFEPVAQEVDAVLSFLEAIGLLQIPTA